MIHTVILSVLGALASAGVGYAVKHYLAQAEAALAAKFSAIKTYAEQIDVAVGNRFKALDAEVAALKAKLP